MKCNNNCQLNITISRELREWFIHFSREKGIGEDCLYNTILSDYANKHYFEQVIADQKENKYKEIIDEFYEILRKF